MEREGLVPAQGAGRRVSLALGNAEVAGREARSNREPRMPYQASLALIRGSLFFRCAKCFCIPLA